MVRPRFVGHPLFHRGEVLECDLRLGNATVGGEEDSEEDEGAKVLRYFSTQNSVVVFLFLTLEFFIDPICVVRCHRGIVPKSTSVSANEHRKVRRRQVLHTLSGWIRT